MPFNFGFFFSAGESRAEKGICSRRIAIPKRWPFWDWNFTVADKPNETCRGVLQQLMKFKSVRESVSQENESLKYNNNNHSHIGLAWAKG